MTLNGSNTYSGGTVLAGGLLNLGNASAVGTGPLTISGGSLDNSSGAAMTLSNNNPLNWNGNFVFLGSNPLNTGNGPVTLNAATTVTVSGSGALTVGGAIGGGSALTKNGSGTLVLPNSNSYSGGTTVAGGVLSFVAGGLGFGNVAFSGGTLQWAAGNNQDISPQITIANSNQTACLDLNGNSVTFGSTISGGGGLTLVGGNLTLAASCTYSGPTTIGGGTLQVGNGGSTGSLGSGAIVDNGVLVYNLGTSALASLPAAGTTGSGSITATAGNVTFNGSVTTGGNQYYNATATGSATFKGVNVAAGNVVLTATGGSSITLIGDIGNSQGATVNNLILNTSSGNGTIESQLLGRGIWYLGCHQLLLRQCRHRRDQLDRTAGQRQQPGDAGHLDRGHQLFQQLRLPFGPSHDAQLHRAKHGQRDAQRADVADGRRSESLWN